MMIKLTWSMMGVIMITALGCGGGSSPTPADHKTVQPVVVKTKPVPEAVSPKAEEKPEENTPEFRYLPANRRDPFISILVTTEGRRSLENLPPLQRTQIDDLRVIGIIWGGYGLSAMIQTPDGKGYSIRRGTLIGPNRGRVIRITKRFVMVEEKYMDIFGERKTREVKLVLHPEKEGTE